MSETCRERDVNATPTELRSALRRKLLSIVHPDPAPIGELVIPVPSLVHRESRGCALLLEVGSESLNVEEIVTDIRARYPNLNVVLLRLNDELRNLPCEFGTGALRLLAAHKSPVARAASISRWNSLRSPSLDQAVASSDNARQAASSDDPSCPARERRD